MEVEIIVISILFLVTLMFLLIFVDTLLSKDDFRNYAKKAIKENLFGCLIHFFGGVVLVIIFKMFWR